MTSLSYFIAEVLLPRIAGPPYNDSDNGSEVLYVLEENVRIPTGASLTVPATEVWPFGERGVSARSGRY